MKLGGEATQAGVMLDTAGLLPSAAGATHLPAVRGDLLAKLGRLEEAREEFGRAAALTGNERERAVFRARATACTARAPAEG